MADDQPYQMESATSIVVIILIVLVIIGIIILMVAWFNSSNAPQTNSTQNKSIDLEDNNDDPGAAAAPASGSKKCGPCGGQPQNKLPLQVMSTQNLQQPNKTVEEFDLNQIPILTAIEPDEDEDDDPAPHTFDIKTPSDGSVINLMLSDKSEIHIHVSDKSGSGPVRRLLSGIPSDQSEQISIENSSRISDMARSAELASVEDISAVPFTKMENISDLSPKGILDQMEHYVPSIMPQSIVIPKPLPTIPVVNASQVDEISGESIGSSLSDPANFSSDFSSQTEMSHRPGMVQPSNIRIPAPPPKVPSSKIPSNLKMGPLSSGSN